MRNVARIYDSRTTTNLCNMTQLALRCTMNNTEVPLLETHPLPIRMRDTVMHFVFQQNGFQAMTHDL
jgi:hypothetical protein